MKKYILRLSLVFGIMLANMLTFTLLPSASNPFVTTTASAGVMEDCDLDGFDDHTGARVPWTGFDGTKGDTVPSDWDGSTTYSSYSAYKKANSSSSSNSTGSVSSNSNGSSSKENNSDSSSNSNKSNKSNNSSAKNKSTKTSSKASKSSSASKKTNSSSTEKVTDIKSEEVTTAENKKKKSKTKKKTKAKEETTTSNNQAVELLKGKVEAYEEDGSFIHAGSQIVIKGSNFNGNIDGIIVEIHSKNKINLGTVATDKDGNFKILANLPENLEEGNHKIVVLYQGKELSSLKVQIGEKAASSLFDALTVGFSQSNAGLVPGIIILTTLLLLGLGVTAIGIVSNLIKK